MGAGFDTTYFRLRDAGLTRNLVRYIEVDVPNVMERKVKMLAKHKMLKKLVIDYFFSFENIDVKCSSFVHKQTQQWIMEYELCLI